MSSTTTTDDCVDATSPADRIDPIDATIDRRATPVAGEPLGGTAPWAFGRCLAPQSRNETHLHHSTATRR